MNKLLDNLLTIHEKMSDTSKFVNIKANIENLNTTSPNYGRLVDDTSLLVNILTAFECSKGDK